MCNSIDSNFAIGLFSRYQRLVSLRVTQALQIDSPFDCKSSLLEIDKGMN